MHGEGGFGRPPFSMQDTQSERAKYQEVWTNPEYRVRSPGMRHLASALDWMRPEPGSSITDWGSGSGQAADAMASQGFDVRLVDIAANAYTGLLPVIEACLWELPADMPATDYGFCADVMEHLPPDRVADVLQHIAARTVRKCYFQIALFRDTYFTHAGPLHLSVFPQSKWKALIGDAFKSTEYRAIGRKHLLAMCSA